MSQSSTSTQSCIVIAHATAGAGHRRAADAIASAARSLLPEAAIHCVDILEYTPVWFKKIYPWGYDSVVRHAPACWAFGYNLLDNRLIMGVLRPIRRLINQLIAVRFKAQLSAWDPDVVIATHFLPADLFGAWKKSGFLKAKFVVVVTDVHPHRIWLAKELDRIVLGSHESVKVCKDRGIDPSLISPLGIPVDLRESSTSGMNSLLNKYSIGPDKLTVLVVGGETTMGSFVSVSKSLMELHAKEYQRMNLVIVCGSNEKDRYHLTNWAKSLGLNTPITGFIDHLTDLMSTAQLIVAKAGGLIMTESLAAGLPLIIYHAIPGQERRNAEYIVSHNAGKIVKNAAEASNAVKLCIKGDDTYKSMKEAAIRIGRPNAAQAIIEEIVIPWIRGVD